VAIQTRIYFIGRMGNVVGSAWKGIPYMCYQPDTINQSEPTKKSSANMGKASRIGAGLRRLFEHVLSQPLEKSVRDNFTGAIKKWLQTKPFEQTLSTTVLPFINGFEFNAKERFRVPLTLQTNMHGQLMLKIPAFISSQAIIAPAYTNAVNIDIAAACYNMNEFVPVGNYHTSVNITYNKIAIPEQVIPFPFSIPSGSITAVLITLKYLQRKKGIETIVQNLRWLPCGIGCGYVC